MKIYVTGYNNSSILGKFENIHMFFLTGERANQHLAVCDRGIKCNATIMVFNAEVNLK